MAVKNIAQAIPYATIASSALTASYQAINPGGLPNACFLIRIVNDSNAAVKISYDQTIPADSKANNDYIAANEELQLNFQTNQQPNNQICNMPQGTVVYIKGTAGTGNVYLIGYYQPSAG